MNRYLLFINASQECTTCNEKHGDLVVIEVVDYVDVNVLMNVFLVWVWGSFTTPTGGHVQRFRGCGNRSRILVRLPIVVLIICALRPRL